MYSVAYPVKEYYVLKKAVPFYDDGLYLTFKDDESEF